MSDKRNWMMTITVTVSIAATVAAALVFCGLFAIQIMLPRSKDSEIWIWLVGGIVLIGLGAILMTKAL